MATKAAKQRGNGSKRQVTDVGAEDVSPSANHIIGQNGPDASVTDGTASDIWTPPKTTAPAGDDSGATSDGTTTSAPAIGDMTDGSTSSIEGGSSTTTVSASSEDGISVSVDGYESCFCQTYRPTGDPTSPPSYADPTGAPSVAPSAEPTEMSTHLPTTVSKDCDWRTHTAFTPVIFSCQVLPQLKHTKAPTYLRKQHYAP